MRELQTALKLHKFINTANSLVLLTDIGLRHYWHLLHRILHGMLHILRNATWHAWVHSLLHGVLHSLLARLHLRELLLHTRHHYTGLTWHLRWRLHALTLHHGHTTTKSLRLSKPLLHLWLSELEFDTPTERYYTLLF